MDAAAVTAAATDAAAVTAVAEDVGAAASWRQGSLLCADQLIPPISLQGAGLCIGNRSGDQPLEFIFIQYTSEDQVSNLENKYKVL